MTKRTFRELFPDEVEALRAYAKRHGRKWKGRLQLDWYHARAEPTLHAIRNDPRLGHQWLEKVNVKDFL